MNNGLIVSVSPHYHKQGATTQRVMRDVLIALIPALIASVIIFGFRSLLLVAVSAANCASSYGTSSSRRSRPLPISPRSLPACSSPTTSP